MRPVQMKNKTAIVIMKKSISIWLIVLFALIAGCQRTEQVRTLRLAHVLDTASPVHQAMAFLGKRLEELSGGKFRILLYPGGQLGNERESLELLQLGSLDIAKVSSAVMENFVPEMGVFSLPYLFRDSDHYWQVFNGEIGKEILLKGEKYWLRGLCYYDAGFRSFFLCDKKVEQPQDLKGLKIRVMRSNLQIRTINLLGGNATPLSWGELYSALQQGVVDGAENNPPNFYQNKFYELCNYFVLDEHSAPPDVLVMSTHTWNKMSDTERRWLEQAVEESVAFQRKLWHDMTQEALNAVKKAGVTVIQPDKQPFFESVAPIYKELEGTELGRLAERIRNLPVASDSGGTR